MLLPLLALLTAQNGQVAGRPRGPVDLPPTWEGYAASDRISGEIGLPRLRTAALPARDLELRVWIGPLSPRAYRLTRRAGVWRGEGIDWTHDPRTNRAVYRLRAVPAPKRGWNAVWADLEALGLLTIPDAASLPDDGVRIYDGVAYLFEIRRGGWYRAYAYDNPGAHPNASARRVDRMARGLGREFPRATH